MICGEAEFPNNQDAAKRFLESNTVHKFELTFQKPNDMLIKHKNYNRY